MGAVKLKVDGEPVTDKIKHLGEYGAPMKPITWGENGGIRTKEITHKDDPEADYFGDAVFTICGPLPSVIKSMTNDSKVRKFEIEGPGLTISFDGRCCCYKDDRSGEESRLTVNIFSNPVRVREDD